MLKLTSRILVKRLRKVISEKPKKKCQWKKNWLSLRLSKKDNKNIQVKPNNKVKDGTLFKKRKMRLDCSKAKTKNMDWVGLIEMNEN